MAAVSFTRSIMDLDLEVLHRHSVEKSQVSYNGIPHWKFLVTLWRSGSDGMPTPQSMSMLGEWLLADGEVASKWLPVPC